MRLQEPLVHEKEFADSEACSALLQRVLASPQLRRAARMREFLQFVGQRALTADNEQIHEQEIGAEVFGRSPGYDTSVDNIVRVNATDLRKRIEDYFSTDGAHETLIFEIPRGSYKPVFRQRVVDIGRVDVPTPDEPTAPVPEILDLPAVTPTRRSTTIALAISCATIVLLAIACGVLWVQKQQLSRPRYAASGTPVLGSFWSEFLNARPNTDVILADTSSSLIEDITKKPIPLDAYLNRNYISALQSPTLSADRREDLGLIVQRNYGSIGDFHVAQLITGLDPMAKNLHLYYARDYTPPLIKQDNIILIGSRKSNPWVDLFAGRLNFTVEYDADKLTSYVKNRSPAPGEQAMYFAPPAPDPTTGYCVVAYLPNADQNGKVLIIAGTGSEATEGAGDFLTSEESLASFEKLLHVKTLPYFEVVLRTTHLNSTPLSASIVAYRTRPDLR